MRIDFVDMVAATFMITVIALMIVVMGFLIYEMSKDKPDIYPICSTIDLWEINDAEYIRMTEQESAEYCK